jgi:cobalamin biosynthesis protein CobD/CbiB
MTMTSQRRTKGKTTFFGVAVVLIIVAVMLVVAAAATKEPNLYLWAGILVAVALVLFALGRRPHKAAPDAEA